MKTEIDPKQKQVLDDVFDAFSLIAKNGFVSVMHIAANVTRHSPNAVKLLDLPGEYIENGAFSWNNYIHPEDRHIYNETMKELMAGKSQTYDVTYRLAVKDGGYETFRVLGAVLHRDDGQPIIIGGVAISETKMQDIDPVTILPNQNAFKNDLSVSVGKGINTISLQVGVSKFTDINKKYGYSYGNRLLQETAFLIQEIVKDRGKVYRLKGSSFLVYSESITKEELAAIYDMIRYRMQRGVLVNGVRNILSACGGLISTFGSNADAGAVLTALNYAYEDSKHHRQGELVDFNGSINYESSNSIALISTIRDSVLDECRGFGMVYEPVFNSNTEKITGAVANIYWENEKFGRVESEDFIPILERDFIYEELANHTMKQALCDGVEVLKHSPNFLLCINVYKIQLETGYFRENLFYYLEETGFPPSLLSLNLAADCRSLGKKYLTDLIETLHRKHILVIIDGFGSGTNSIIFLKNAAVDAVNLDSQFLNGVENPGRDRDILEYLTRMAATCVESINISGVETKEIREALKYIPLTTLQGKYFSEPLSIQELIEKYYK